VSGFRREELKNGNPKPHMKLHDIRCHFHEVSSSIKLAASAASGGAEH